MDKNRAGRHLRVWCLSLGYLAIVHLLGIQLTTTVLAKTSSTQPVDTSYLAEMPDSPRVLQDMQGKDEFDTAVRQKGALHILRNALEERTLGRVYRNELTKGEAAKREAYRQEENRLQGEWLEKLPFCKSADDSTCPRIRFLNAEHSAELKKEVFDRYFSKQWQGGYRKEEAAMEQRIKQNGAGQRAVTEERKRNPVRSSLVSIPTVASDNGFKEIERKIMMEDFESILIVFVLPILILFWIVRKILKRRSRVVRRSNREALKLFGNDKDAREHAILDAFETPDFTFRYTGVNRNSGNKMRFVLLRSIKSFRRGDLEALRFAYLAFNRGLIDDEKFHWFRFSAIYAGGQTDPSEWKFLGLFSFLRSSQGAIDQARACVANFAQANGGADLEAQALATIQKLAMDHPSDDLYRDLQRRFVDGVYWLTKGEIKRSAFAPSNSPYGLTFGLLDGTDTELVYSGDGSVMTIAPPGSGKTQCNVLPNLLRWPGPAVVLDVKGELFDQTSRWRAANVGPVIKFSPLDPAKSACYNPLTAVRRESLFIWEDSRFLASMMIVPVAKEPFWEDKAREILTAIIADVSFWNAPDERPMSKVLSLVNRNGWTEFVQRLSKNPELATMRDEGANLAHMEAKTLDGALQTAKASLSAWVGERIARVTRQSDWSPMDLRNGKNPTIYICIKPNEIDSYMSLLRVVIAQHIRGLTSGEIPPRDAAPILFVLDELPRLKQMAPVEEALEVGRGYGIKLWMISQSLGQMRSAYPNADGMIGSCAVRSFMNPSLQDGTAKMLAEQIGYRKGEEHGGKERALNANPQLVVDPAQLAGAEFKELQIVIGVGTKPAKVKKVYAYKDQTLTTNMGAVQPAQAEPATI